MLQAHRHVVNLRQHRRVVHECGTIRQRRLMSEMQNSSVLHWTFIADGEEHYGNKTLFKKVCVEFVYMMNRRYTWTDLLGHATPHPSSATAA